MSAGKGAGAALLLLALAAAGCSDPQTTTTPAATETVAPATTVETFEGSVQAAGSVFYSFQVPVNGTVNVTLVSVDGADIPVTVGLGLGIGIPSGTGCGSVTPAVVQAGPDPQVTGTYGPGRYCVQLSDVGNLSTTAAFTITIAHP